jgi:hypothetical protein
MLSECSRDLVVARCPPKGGFYREPERKETLISDVRPRHQSLSRHQSPFHHRS